MELNPKQQTIELIRASQRILLLTHHEPDGDAIGSLLAFALVLQKMGKDVTASYSGLLSSAFSFLPLGIATQNPTFSKDFIINLNISKTKVDRISYNEAEPGSGKLSLILTPESGRFTPSDISFSEGRVKYDLICILDAAGLDRVGDIYEKNKEIFNEAPVINIDHHATNDSFGKVNLIDTNATSAAEILVSLIESLSREKNLIDPVIATCLLTGLIYDTDSFQNDNTTPKSFTVAAQLVAAGAKQQDIIRNLYMNKSFAVLRVWGKILSNLTEETAGFVWSKISQKDFKECNADSTSTTGINNELLRTVPNVYFSLLLTEKEDGYLSGSLRSARNDYDVTKIAKLFGGGGHSKAAGFQLKGNNFDLLANEAVTKIKNFCLDTRKNDNENKTVKEI